VTTGAADDAPLEEVLATAQRLGMLGDRPIPEVVAHARCFLDAMVDVEGAVLDLGSGAGIPGLVLAWDRPDLHVVLLDRRARRTDHLRRAVSRLGLTRRVEVWTGDADVLRRRQPVSFEAVTARGFGPPDVTLRAAVAWLRPGGRIIVSEPPGGDRWPSHLVEELGLVRSRAPHVVVFDRPPTPS
jgi:16S rRNA (guanine527-N7)-methyltransferase